MTVHELRRWIRQSPYHLPYVNWLRRERIVAWLEANVERQVRSSRLNPDLLRPARRQPAIKKQ